MASLPQFWNGIYPQLHLMEFIIFRRDLSVLAVTKRKMEPSKGKLTNGSTHPALVTLTA